jgi:hypothetical protein
LPLFYQKKELFFGGKIFGEAFSPPSNYANANGDIKAGFALFLCHLMMWTTPEFDTL